MSTLVFNPSIPTGGQTIASTTIPIQTNFQSLDSAFNSPVGGVTGGGTFSSFSFQATTTSFTTKPVDPIGVLYTTTSSAGHPELAYINNVDSVGGGPFTGTQLTGGGVTTAAWAVFNTTVPTILSGYNIASISYSAPDFTITFTRDFNSSVMGNYVADIRVTGNFATSLVTWVTATNAHTCTFRLLNNGTPFTGSSYVTALFFGYLL